MGSIGEKVVLVLTIVFIAVFGVVINAVSKETDLTIDYLGKSVRNFCDNKSTMYISKICVDGYTYIVVQDANGISITQSMYQGIKGTLPYRCKNTTKEEEESDEE